MCFSSIQCRIFGTCGWSRGLSPDPTKVQAFRDWKVPGSVIDVSSFLGLAEYYRQFIPQFARIAAPFTNLTRKDHPFAWTLREGEAFYHLKDALVQAPILQLVDPFRKFIVTTDASDFVVGAVLSQVWDDGEHFVAYENRKMNAIEVNHATHERELLVFIHAFHTWRHYLLGNRFIVVTDHNSLNYLQTQPTLSRRQARWSEFLAEFDFEIVYRSRKGNVVVDDLSQLNVVDCGIASKRFNLEDLFKGIEQAYQKEKETKRLLEGLDNQKDFIIIQNKYIILKWKKIALPSIRAIQGFDYARVPRHQVCRSFGGEKDIGANPKGFLLAYNSS